MSELLYAFLFCIFSLSFDLGGGWGGGCCGGIDMTIHEFKIYETRIYGTAALNLGTNQLLNCKSYCHTLVTNAFLFDGFNFKITRMGNLPAVILNVSFSGFKSYTCLFEILV